MHRRHFIRNLTTASAAACCGNSTVFAKKTKDLTGKVMTVLGPVPEKELGFTLTHEHILVDFVGAEKIRRGGYDYDLISPRTIPHLKELKKLGVDSLVECTPAYLGRDPVLLVKLSQETGFHLITNTGFYGAQDGKFVPSFVDHLSADRLAEIWIREANAGIDGSGVLPGFVKMSVNQGPLNELDRKLIRAAAITHRETGLMIHSHSSKTPISGIEQIKILKEEGVSPSAWVWVHANSMSELEGLRPGFEAGAWISFDKLRPDKKSVDHMLNCLRFAEKNGWLDQVLISHDAGWFDPNKPDGGEHRPYTAYFTHFLPVAIKAGFSRETLNRISSKNAFNALKIGKRLA